MLVLFVVSCEVLIDPDKALLLGRVTITNPNVKLRVLVPGISLSLYMYICIFRYTYIGIFSLIDTHCMI